MSKLNKSAPWVTYYEEMRELFKCDPGIKIVYDDENKEINVYAVTPEKAAALKYYLPTEKEFGKIIFNINVIPPNSSTLFKIPNSTPSIDELFKGNTCVDYIAKLDGWFAATYVVFHKEVVQYFDDNIGDINGNISTLYENIARDVLNVPGGIFFCTNKVFKFDDNVF